MSHPAYHNEQEIAAAVVAHFEGLGCDVYQEVTLWPQGAVADIVVKVNAEVWIIEVKTSLSLALIVQAEERRRWAHRVWIAVPIKRGIRDACRVVKALGLGLMTVTGIVDDRRQCHVEVNAPRLTSKPLPLSKRLCAEHKTHAKAGAVGAAGRWTPFRRTCEAITRIVREQPGITLKMAIEETDHHYASAAGARSSVAHWIERGTIDGVRIDRADGVARLFPAETKDA